MADQGILTAHTTSLSSNQKALRESLGLPTAPRGILIKRVHKDIPGLMRGDVKSLMVEIAQLETGNNESYNQNNRYGKYAIHKNTLINYGYLSDDGTAWLGVEGIQSAANFIASTKLQDRIMERFISEQYHTGIKVGAIKPNDGLDTVAGMLAVAYQFQDYTYATNNLAPNVSVILNNINYFANNSMVQVTTTTNHNLRHNQSFIIKTQSNVDLNGTFTVDKLLNSTTIEYLSPNIGIVEEYGFTRSWTSDGGTITSPATVSNINTSYLVSRGANLVTQLSNTLNTLGYANVAYNHYVESNIGPIATDYRQNSISTNPSMSEKRLWPIIEDINDTSIKTVSVVQTALASNIEGLAKQRAIVTARESIGSFSTKLQNIYANLPANRAKEWREAGNVNDSQNRPGALFFNAGKYAINNLGAGVTV